MASGHHCCPQPAIAQPQNRKHKKTKKNPQAGQSLTIKMYFKIMKKSFFLGICCMGLFLTANAQQPTTIRATSTSNVTTQDYEHMLESAHNVGFRTYVINSLGLTESQIKAFDPMYRDYMSKKNELAQKKMKLYNDYLEEIAENDSPRNEENDKEEFIEDYLEVETAESKLRKEAFDRMEDVITADNALGFLLLDDMAASHLYDQMLYRHFTPYVVVMEGSNPTPTSGNVTGSALNEKYSNSNENGMNNREMTNYPNSTNTLSSPNSTNSPNSTMSPSSASPSTTAKGTTARTASASSRYRTDITTYSSWAKSTKANVGGSHQYTRDGLKSAVTAIGSLRMACNGTADNAFESKKNKITQNCNKLTEDPHSTTHPALMRESFILVADLLKEVQQQCSHTNSTNAVNQVADAARKLDLGKTTDSQAALIQDFFKKTQIAIDDMADDISWSNN